MPEDTNPKASREAVDKRPGAAEKPIEEKRYGREDLIRASKALLGVKPMYVAGALARADQNRKTFTLAEAKGLVDEHMKTPEPLEEVSA